MRSVDRSFHFLNKPQDNFEYKETFCEIYNRAYFVSCFTFYDFLNCHKNATSCEGRHI